MSGGSLSRQFSHYPNKRRRTRIAAVSVVILTKDEERNIAECLESVRWADEIVVVDSGSRDKTCEIAAGLGATVVEHELNNFAEQRNYAATLTSGDWILYLDADERVSSALREELAGAALQLHASGFWIPTLNYVFGAPLKHGGWYPQPHIRFVRQGKGTWMKQVDEVLAVEGSVGWLRSPLLHYGHPNIHAFVRKLNRYTDMEAWPKRRHPVVLAVAAVLEPPAYFIYKYVFQGGFMDGWRGLAAALLLSFYRCLTYLKALERLWPEVKRT